MTIHDEGVAFVEASLDDYEIIGDRPRMTWRRARNIYGRPLWAFTKRAAHWAAIVALLASKWAVRASKYAPDVAMAIIFTTMVRTFVNMEQEVRGAEGWIGVASAGLAGLGLIAGYFWGLGPFERHMQTTSSRAYVPIAQSVAGATVLFMAFTAFTVGFTYNLAQQVPVVVGRFFVAVLIVAVAATYYVARRHVVSAYRRQKARRRTTAQPV